MFNPTYIAISRHGVFYLRYPLPRELHPQQKPSTLKVSLGTRDPRSALWLARELSYSIQRALAQGVAAGMEYDKLRSAVKLHFTALLSLKKKQIGSTGPLDSLDIISLENSAAFSEDAVQHGWPYNLADDQPTVDAFIAKYELPITAGSAAYQALRTEIFRGHRDYCRTVLAHNRDQQSYDFSPVPTASHADKWQADEGTADATLQDVIERFVIEKQRSHAWVLKTEAQKDEHWRLLTEVLGADRLIRDVKLADARKIKAVLMAYPKNRNKNPSTRGLSLSDAIVVAGAEKIQSRTISKYLVSYSDLFGYAVSDGYVNDNIFKEMTVQQGKTNGSSGKTGFTEVQVAIIKRELIHNTMGLLKKESFKWAAMLSLYTGARLNEVCQLRIEDIRNEGPISYIAISDESELQTLKTSSSRRDVPIHSDVLALGFIHYLNSVKDNASCRLFPDFTYSKTEQWGRKLGRFFNETFLVKLGIKSPELSFHSLRHTAATILYNSDVQHEMVQAIIGHAPKDITQGVYFKSGYTMQQKATAIEKIRYPA